MIKDNILSENLNRRNFLVNVLKKSGQITLASSVIYSISLISSDNQFGNMAAGAKACPGPMPSNSCPPVWNPMTRSTVRQHRCGMGWWCDVSTGVWVDERDCIPVVMMCP
ncbi:MAG: hypothetical protein WA160_00110 [Pseudobdellovibrio sp.]